MRRAIPPLPQYVFMAWCLVKRRGQLMWMDLKRIGFEDVDWIQLPWDSLQRQDVVNTVINVWLHKRSGIYSPAE
jgi:hypothetical protein